jgi:hypothetical protein
MKNSYYLQLAIGILCGAVLLLTVPIAGCSQTGSVPTVDATPPPSTASDASPVAPIDFRSPARRSGRAGRAGVALEPAPVDTRTPLQIAQAACAGRCIGTAIPKMLTASTETPIVWPSWTVPNWYIDPSNSSGVASDNNSGTAATGTAGSGIGPLLTYQELNVHRWGCQGNPVLCPRLRQVTTVTFLSSQTNNSDPVYVTATMENAGQLTLQGNLGAAQQVCSTTLSAVTAKNRSTPQLLNVTFTACAGAAVNKLVVNTTHPSRAWIYTAGGGSSWNMSQPLTTTVPGGAFPTEVDTWAATDAVTVYTPTAVNVPWFFPQTIDYNGGFTNLSILSQLTVYDPSGIGNDNVFFGGSIEIIESVLQRGIIEIGTQSFNQLSIVNVDNLGGLAAQGTISPFATQQIGGIVEGYQLQPGGYHVDSDVILSAANVGSGVLGPTTLGAVYIDTGLTVGVQGWSGFTSALNTPVVWGPGTLDVEGRLQYPTGASGARSMFLTGIGNLTVELNSQGLCCKNTPNSGTLTCDQTLSPLQMDTNAGTTNGCTLVPGGGSFCNYGP